jgi:autotransporter family porin
MADRYWVGGSDTWNSTAGLKWATTSGGAGGASAPTTSDNVFINAASGAGTITLGVGQSGNVIDFTGFTGTLNLAVGFGTRGLILSTGMTLSGTSTVSVTSPQLTTVSLNTNGKTLPSGLNISTVTPSPGSVQLLSTVVVTGQLFINDSSTFNLNGFDISCNDLNFSSSTTVAFGSNKINITGNNQLILNQPYSSASSYTGSGGIYATYTGSVGTRSFSAGTTGTVLTNGSAPLYITGGTDRINFSSSIFSFGVNFTGFSGTLGLASASGTKTIGCTWSTCVFVNTFVIESTSTVLYVLTGKIAGTVSGSQYWRLGGGFDIVTLANNFTNIFNGTYQAVGNSANIYLSGFALTFDNLVMPSSGLRLIGPGTVNITGNNKTVLRTYSSPQLENSVVINLTYSGSVGTRTITDTYLDLYNLLPTGTSLNITGGTDIIDFGTTLESYVQNIDFTGFSGTIRGNFSVSGNLTLASTNNFDPVSAITYRSSSNSNSGTYGLATTGGACKCPTSLLLAWTTSSFVISGASTVRLLNNVTLTDNAAFNAVFNLRAGIVDLNGFDLSVPQFNFSFSTNTYKRIIFSTGNKIIANSRGVITLFGTTYSTFFTYVSFVAATAGANLFEISGSSGQSRSVSLFTSPTSFFGATDSSAIRLSIVNTSDAVTISDSKFNGLTTDNTFSGSILFSGTPYFTGPIVFGSTGTITGAAGGSPIIRPMSGCTLSSGITLQCGISVINFNAIYSAGLVLASNVTVQVLNPAQIDFILGNTQNSGSPASVDLSSFTLNVGAIEFSGLGSAGKTFNFNTGTLNITGNGKTVLNTSGFTPTYSGTNRQFNLTYSGSVGTRSIYHAFSTYGGPSLRVTGGSDIISNITGTSGFGSIDFTGFTGTFNGNNLTSYGNYTLNAGMSAPGTTLAMNANTSLTSTFTRNGASITAGLIIFGGPGTCSLSGSLITTSAFRIIGDAVAGHIFQSNNNVITCEAFQSNVATSRTINLGTSTVTINAGTFYLTAVDLNSTGLTFNGSSAPITVNLPTTTTQTHIFSGASQTFGNVVISSGVNSCYGFTLRGANTYANLTLPRRNGIGSLLTTIDGTQTISGTLDFNGSGSADARNSITPTSAAVVNASILAGAVSNLTDIDFYRITALGAVIPWSGTRLGDAGNNVNITFASGTNKYYVSAASSVNYSASTWALSSGGSTSSANFPLPQDTVFIDDNSVSSSGAFTVDYLGFLPSVTTVNRTTPATVTVASLSVFSRNVTLSSPITINFGGCNFTGTGTLTQNSASLAGNFTVGYNGSLTIGDNLTSSGNITLSNGNLNLDNRTVNLAALSCLSNAQVLAFGVSGVLNLTSSFSASSASSLFSITGSKTLNFTGAGAKAYNGFPDSSSSSSAATALNIDSVPSATTLNVSGCVGTLNLSGYTSTLSVPSTLAVFGDVTLNAAMAFGTVSTTRFRSTGTQTITSNGRSWPSFFAQGGASVGTVGTVRLLDNLVVNSSYNLADGTFDFNGNTLTVTSFNVANFGTIPATPKVINIGSGTLNLTGSATTVLSVVSTFAANASVVASGIANVNLNGTGTKTVNINGANFSGLNIVNNNAAGSVSFTTNGTFSRISNAFSPATFTFTAGTTTTLTDTLNLNGTAGNLVTLVSSSTGTRYTLSSAVPTQSVTFTSIRDSDATGGSTWNALTSSGNVDAGNNLGWIFAASGNVNVNLTGVAATGQVGVVTINNVSVNLTGVAAFGQVGSVTVAVPDISVNLVGVTAFGVTFPSNVQTDANFSVTGVSATGLIGVVYFTNEEVNVSGVSATGFVGSPTVIGFTNVAVSVTGVSATGFVSAVSIASIVVNVNGVVATGFVGSPTVSGFTNVAVNLNGIGCQGEVGILFFFQWSTIIDAQDPNWAPINDSNTPTWALVYSLQNPNWAPINDSNTPTWATINPNNTPVWTDVIT